MPLATSALIGAGLGAAAGGVKAKLAADKEARDRKLAADTQRLSPWTGLQAKMPEHADAFGDVLQGAVGGGMTGQSLGGAPLNTGGGAAALPGGSPLGGAGMAAKLGENSLGQDPNLAGMGGMGTWNNMAQLKKPGLLG